MSAPKPGVRFDPKSPVNQATAATMLASVKLAMDERAWDLFNRWFEGKAPAVVVLETPAWTNYMRADKRLADSIRTRLTSHAESLRTEMDAAIAGATVRRPLRITFHAEVGSKPGGYVTGYEVLHGSNAAAGDFEITGFWAAKRDGAPGGAYSVSYEQLRYAFNDIVDANKKWSADVTLARTAGNMAAALRVGPPKDYRVKIQWAEVKPIVIAVEARVAGKAPTWLKTFPNR